MLRAPMDFLDVQSHPLMFRRSQSRDILDAYHQQQEQQHGVSTFQHLSHQHPSGAGSGALLHTAAVNNQILPLMEVRTLGRPVNKKRGQNTASLSSTSDATQQQAKLQAQV